MLAPLAPRLIRRRLAQGREDPSRWRERLGEPGLPRPAGRLVWVHAASVGEGLSVLPLVAGLRAATGAAVLMTTVTRSAQDLLAARVPIGVALQYLPLDTPQAVGRFLAHWRPDAGVFVESELWPRLILRAAAAGIPLALVNARLSPASAARWTRAPRLARALFGRFALVTTADAALARRVQGWAGPGVRVETVASPKAGAGRLPVDAAALTALRAAFAGRPLWLAASTHPGEEALALAAQRLAAASVPGLALVLAPRHPDRATAILAETTGLTVTRRSAGDRPGQGTEVYLADTLGEMGLWYDLCPLALVGGSLVPGIGGHNPYEPAAHGAAILAGPHVANFAEPYARLASAGGLHPVATAEDLAAALIALQDPAPRSALSRAAAATLAPAEDPVAATLALLQPALGLPTPEPLTPPSPRIP
jgi:3-deoxy-D-manno-octulosonic-acid transferase